MNTYFMHNNKDIGEIREYLTSSESNFRIYYYIIAILFILSMTLKFLSIFN